MRSTPTRGQGFRLALAFCASLISLPLASGHPRAEETVQALRYGVTLFHYYQQDYFNAPTDRSEERRVGKAGGSR